MLNTKEIDGSNFTLNKEINNLKNDVDSWNKKAIKIQKKFDFLIPNYIIDEILEDMDTSADYKNLYLLINCAVFNNKLTFENGEKIKKIYLLK